MRYLTLLTLAVSLSISAAASAQDAAPPADTAEPAPAQPTDASTAPAADAAPTDAVAAEPAPAAPADASAPTDAAPAATDTAAAEPVEAGSPADPLEGIRDIDYIAVMGHYLFADTDRGPDVHYGAGASIVFGRHFANHWGWEAIYGLDTIETGSAGGGDYYRHTLGGDLTYSFGDRQHLTPYALVGGGATFDDVHPRVNGGASGYLDGGLGVVSRTFWHNRVRLRAEGRVIHDFISTPANDGFTDYRVSIGLEIPFYELKPSAPPPEQQVQIVKVPTGLEDSDGDGVVDSADKCPDTPPNTRVDGDGCPIPKTLLLKGVTFEFNKTRLRPDAETILSYVIGIMKKYPDMQVELAGYTDSIGKAAYNLRLSQKRAESVKAYLVEKGIDGGRIQAMGYGKKDPVATNDTAEGREFNRRVELHILN